MTPRDEIGYGFTTENEHDGATRKPHDPSRSAGGSCVSSAAGLVPISLGTDTNESVRVPAPLRGVFGLKPTLGRLSHAGVQIIAAPWCEALTLAAAAFLERAGIVEARPSGHRVGTSSDGSPTPAGTMR